MAGMVEGSRFVRDHLGRPLIPDLDSGMVRPYQRVTTFAGKLADRSGLKHWYGQQVAMGGVVSPELLARAAGERDFSKRSGMLEELVGLAGGNAGRDFGTRTHAVMADLLSGRVPLDAGPEELDTAHIAAEAVEKLGGVRAVEADIVNDRWECAGTADVIGDGWIADLKTGKTVSIPETAVQLIAYARGRLWDGESRGEPVAQHKPRLVIVHVPRGAREATVIDVNVEAATRAADLIRVIEKARQSKGYVNAKSVG